MTASTTSNGDRTAPTNQNSGRLERGRSYVRRALGRGRTGTIALLVGGALLVRSRHAKTRARGAIKVLAGLGFIALGIRQRLSREGTFETERSGDGDGPDGDGDDTAGHVDTAATTEHAQGGDTNPRDVTEDPSVETETEPDEGSVRFTTDQDTGPRSKPQLDEADGGEDDPRVDEGDEAVEVDISESAMADEPSEAVGPQDEQAQPASTEATEPEPDPPEDHSDEAAAEPETGGESTEEGEGEGPPAEGRDERAESSDETDQNEGDGGGSDEARES